MTLYGATCYKLYRRITAILVLTFLSITATAGEGPAIWKVSDEDSEIWLFGTIHILKPDTDWYSPALNKAYNRADVVYFEAPADPAGIKPYVMKYGLNTTAPLSAQMTSEGTEYLAQVIQMLGLPQNFPQQLEPLKPWLAAVQIANVQMQASGADPELGADRVLSKRAATDGKKMAYLETDADQVMALANLSPSAQLFFLEDGLKTMIEDPDMVDELIEGWRTGNVAQVDTILLETLEAHPELQKALLLDRNQNWANQINEILKGSGTVLIAVGAGHLVGPDSVQELLRQNFGIIAARE
ncbi:TraB/GumN family protein [Kordiimonas pumila]|uniref:TraB/GumN family protein n=1 Tax=Kordiimonas pumila TaxID=2161677 RepID=A0ABV7D4M0_9PROT|nr:TraB/GumN family protein [Kordiimonas pumila]